MRKKYMESVSGGNSDIVIFRNERIEDLFLDFTLPGYPDFVLASGTDHSMVIIACYFCHSILITLSMTGYKLCIFILFVGKYEKPRGLCFTCCRCNCGVWNFKSSGSF